MDCAHVGCEWEGSTVVVPKELPEMYQVGLILTKLAVSMVNIATFAASMAS